MPRTSPPKGVRLPLWVWLALLVAVTLSTSWGGDRPETDGAPWAVRAAQRLEDILQVAVHGVDEAAANLSAGAPRSAHVRTSIGDLRVEESPETGMFRVVRTGAGLAESASLDRDTLKALAWAIAQRVLSGGLGTPVATAEVATATGVRLFTWHRRVGPDTFSGDSVTVVLSGAGSLVALAECTALRHPDVTEVAVDADRARALGAGLVTEKLLPGQVALLRNATLVLSSPLAEESGPIWLLTYERRPAVRLGPGGMTVAIDAVTGREVTPGAGVR